jgi:hypothetical protein
MISPNEAFDTAVAALELKKDAEKKQALQKEQQKLVELAYLERVTYPDFLQQIGNQILGAAKDGKTGVEINSPADNALGKRLCEMVSTELKNFNYEVRVQETWVPEDRGEGEDCYAYAHEAYHAYTLKIFWNK